MTASTSPSEHGPSHPVAAFRDFGDLTWLRHFDDDLDELIGFVAAEANSEPNRRRQQRLDAAFDALNAAARTPGG